MINLLSDKDLFKLQSRCESTIDDYSKTRSSICDNYHLAKTIIRKLLEQNPESLFKYQKRPGTLKLRDICKEVGFDYWARLDISNAIDYLDCAFTNHNR